MVSESSSTRAQSSTALLEKSANQNNRLIESVKLHYDAQQQEAFLTLESQLDDLARQVQEAASQDL